jgi:hypothetical protein
MSLLKHQWSSVAPAERRHAGPPGASVSAWFLAVAALLLSTLREIFDESAYSRFLARHRMNSCPSAYAAFLREQERTKARRPKCC